MTAMKQQRFVGEHDELIEGQSRGRPHMRQEGGYAVYAVADFVYPGFHHLIPFRRRAAMACSGWRSVSHPAQTDTRSRTTGRAAGEPPPTCVPT